VDVERAADLYARGWTVRQIGAVLGVHLSTVSQQLQSAGVSMRRGGPPAHPASTQKILELRDQGRTWNEIAEQVGMTRSGVWSRQRRPGTQRLHAWAVGSRFCPTPLIRTLRLAYEPPLLIISDEPHPS
jgi:DNA-directed RNA polymerase specialized sigma24 family protein